MSLEGLAILLSGAGLAVTGMLAVAFMGFADAFVHARAGHPSGRHLGAGIAAAVVVLAALLALGAGR